MKGAAAQKAGDLLLLETVKSELDLFKLKGIPPKSVSTKNFDRQFQMERMRLEKAYTEAIKKYTQDGRISEAKIVREEFEEMKKSGFIQSAKFPVGRWIPLMTDPNRITGWNVENATVNYANGLLELRDSKISYPVDSEHIAVSAVVKKNSSQNLSIGIRMGEGTGYIIWFAGGNMFGLGAHSASGYRDLKTVKTPNAFNDSFVLVVAASGDHLRAFANGQKIIDLRDSRFASGKIALGSFRGNSLFRDVKVQMLQPEKSENWVP